ncbi:N-glycosylase/DNA lyase [Orchesella cincta]|uniref:N-glycosylase/DNA lyase n=1 Tax=Orchesella cincta TaxID=48709 RepID=A0A1D2N7E2_ORCCI|nr:N-glycosylase/DNA lyase [Orchesella cincta]
MVAVKGSFYSSFCKHRGMEGSWNTLPVSRTEVEISTVLSCGQSFRWKQLESDDKAWIGTFSHKVWILKQTDTEIHFKVFQQGMEENGDKLDDEKNRGLLYDYFQLEVSLETLYKEWSKRDERFANLTIQDYRGIRMLDQDCVENVFSFICSSNNNIARISQMVEKLCLHYGVKIAEVEGKTYYDFPTVEKLIGEKVEKKLREEKFGYRAGFIAKTAATIVANGGVNWLENLKNVGYDEARKQLQTLPGIGRKVADCVCLMSLGYSEAIPVDTHMHQIAKKYLPHLAKLKTLTDKSYSEITDYFRALHGDYAGWAHSVLFASTLRHLKKDGVTENKETATTEETVDVNLDKSKNAKSKKSIVEKPTTDSSTKDDKQRRNCTSRESKETIPLRFEQVTQNSQQIRTFASVIRTFLCAVAKV